MISPEAIKVIDPQFAAIQTAPVQIRTIMVGKSQMTASVFRQLPEIEIMDWIKVEPIIRPWGWVNYHFKGCDQYLYNGKTDYTAPHVHLICQQGALLHKCTLPKTLAYEDAQKFLDDAWNGIKERSDVVQRSERAGQRKLRESLIAEQWRISLELHDNLRRLRESELRDEDYVRHYNEGESLRARSVNIKAALDAAVYGDFLPATSRDYAEKYAKAIDEILSIGQLYIAV